MNPELSAMGRLLQFDVVDDTGRIMCTYNYNTELQHTRQYGFKFII